jgi:TIR domain-containing protein
LLTVPGLPKPRIFVSHAASDSWVARQLESHIRCCGADTFLDCEHIQHGDDFEEKIIDAAAQCTELLVLFTPTAKDRKYVWLEIGMFLGAKKRIVAALYGVRKDEISTDQLTPVALKRIDSVDINEINSYLVQLKHRVEEWTHRNG